MAQVNRGSNSRAKAGGTYVICTGAGSKALAVGEGLKQHMQGIVTGQAQTAKIFINIIKNTMLL